MSDLSDRLEHLAARPTKASAISAFERARDAATLYRRRRARRRGLAVGATGMAIAVAVALVVHAQPDRHALKVKTGRVPQTVVSIAGVTTTTAVPTTAADAPVCTHKPILKSSDYYHGVPAPAGGTSIVFTEPTDTRFVDHNGADVTTPTTNGNSIMLTQGRTHTEIVRRGYGDFDGDGRTDAMVDLYSQNGGSETFIVRGTLGHGTYDPAVFGVPVPHPAVAPGGFWAFPESVGDQNHDGADDVIFGRLVYSGKQLMSAPRGSALPAPIMTLRSGNGSLGLLDIDSKTSPSFVESDQAATSLDVTDHRSDRLLLDTQPSVFSLALHTGLEIRGWLANGHRIVDAAYSQDGFGGTWRWDLDGPCGK